MYWDKIQLNYEGNVLNLLSLHVLHCFKNFHIYNLGQKSQKNQTRKKIELSYTDLKFKKVY